MQNIRMRFEMPLIGSPQPQQQVPSNQQSTVMGDRFISSFSQQQNQHQRQMNLYSKTNHNGMILSTSNLMASQNTMNNNNQSKTEDKGMSEDALPNKIQSAPLVVHQSDSNDINSNHLTKLKSIANSFAPNSPMSSEDNSPTEMNNCRRMMEKPPLVKRLTMGLLMKTTEDSRPLVYNTHNHDMHQHQLNNSSNCNASFNNRSSSVPEKGSFNCDGYVNEVVCDRDRVITKKFGESCRQSLMATRQVENNQNHDFNFKKNLLRETSISANSSSKTLSSVYKARENLTPQEQTELKGAAWFQAGIPREISLEVLTKQNPGAFIVRQSSSKPGCFALSLRVPPPSPKVSHYLILRTGKGYKIKGFTKEFKSLRALITHHSVMPELLPVPLSLPREMVPQQSRELDDLDSYSSLDFRTRMADLNV